MGTYRLSQYPAVLRSKKNALRKEVPQSSKQAANAMVAMAKQEAPYHSGKTKSGIRVRGRKNGYVAESWVPGMFKQNLFANQTSPYRTLKFSAESKQPYFRVPQSVVYGGPVSSPSGQPVQWTGLPRFWHFSTLRTIPRWRNLYRASTQKALRVGV